MLISFNSEQVADSRSDRTYFIEADSLKYRHATITNTI